MSAEARPAWVLIRREAKLRGFKNAISFRRWCRRNKVPVYKTGRLCAVCPAEVDVAIKRGEVSEPLRHDDNHVADAVAKMMGRK